MLSITVVDDIQKGDYFYLSDVRYQATRVRKHPILSRMTIWFKAVASGYNAELGIDVLEGRINVPKGLPFDAYRHENTTHLHLERYSESTPRIETVTSFGSYTDFRSPEHPDGIVSKLTPETRRPFAGGCDGEERSN